MTNSNLFCGNQSISASKALQKSVRSRSYSGPYFLAFGLNTERCSVSLLIQSECGKIRTRITPNTDTFYRVEIFRELYCFTKLRATWVDDKKNYKIVLDKAKTKIAITVNLLDNCYFTVGNLTFKEVIQPSGLPMGSDPVQFMANLFLYYFENKLILNWKKSNLHKAHFVLLVTIVYLKEMS